jgi:hypothetical protein
MAWWRSTCFARASSEEKRSSAEGSPSPDGSMAGGRLQAKWDDTESDTDVRGDEAPPSGTWPRGLATRATAPETRLSFVISDMANVIDWQ